MSTMMTRALVLSLSLLSSAPAWAVTKAGSTKATGSNTGASGATQSAPASLVALPPLSLTPSAGLVPGSLAPTPVLSLDAAAVAAPRAALDAAPAAPAAPAAAAALRTAPVAAPVLPAAAATDAEASGAGALTADAATGRVADAARMNRVLSGAASFSRRVSPGDAPHVAAEVAAGSLSAGRLAAPSDAPQADGKPAPPEPSATTAEVRPLMNATIVTSLGNQAGYEVTTAALPLAIASIMGSLSKAADLLIIGALASVLGTILSPLIVTRMSLRAAYLSMTAASMALSLVVVGAVALSAVPGSLAALAVMPLLGVGVFGFRLFQGAAGAAERTIVPATMKDMPKAEREALLGTYKGRKHVWSEVASVWTQNAVGSLITAFGFLPVMLISPVLYGIVLAVIAVKIAVPTRVEDARRQERAEAAAKHTDVTLKGQFAKFWGEVSRGSKLVFKSPQLRLILGAASVFLILNWVTYGLIASAFGMLMTGGNAQLAAPIAGLIAGLYSFGGLYTGRLLAAQEKTLEARYGADAAGKAEALRRQNIRWLKLAAVAMLALGVMAVPFGGGLLVAPLGAVLQGFAAWLTASLGVGVTPSILMGLLLGAGSLTAVWRPLLGGALIAGPVFLFFSPAVALAGAAVFVMGYIHFGASLRVDSFYESAAEGQALSDAIGAIGAISRLSAIPVIIGFKFLFWGTLPFEFQPLPGFTGLKDLAALGLPMIQGHAPFVVVAAVAALVGAYLWFVARRLDALTRPAA